MNSHHWGLFTNLQSISTSPSGKEDNFELYHFAFTMRPTTTTNSSSTIKLPQLGQVIDSYSMGDIVQILAMLERDITVNGKLKSNYLTTYLLINLSNQRLRSKCLQKSSRKSDRFKKITFWINEHLDQPLTVSMVANHFDITPEYLTRLFREYECTTALQFIHHAKITKAKQLLLTTSMSVKQVGYHLGFTNINYFMQLFKKETNETPSKFRSA